MKKNLLLVFLATLGASWSGTALADSHSEFAFGEKFMFRIGSYIVENADTEVAIFSSSGVGAGVSFNDDLGGEDDATIPRLDFYYRFNERHRLDFSYFKFDRDGRETIVIDIDLGDQSYSIGDTVVSDIEYELFKFGYGYSFYHSKQVELSFTAGLNITGYDFEYSLADGSDADEADVTAPLPMFGFKMSYAIDSNWSLHFLTEAFYIEIEDTLEGSLTGTEINIEYRFKPGITLGLGLTRLSIDVDADDDDWNGRIVDEHRGFLFYAGYRF